MKRFLFATLVVSFVFFSYASFWSPSLASVSDTVDVHLSVDGCNFNFVCEPVGGESYVSCPSDCVAPSPSHGGGGGGGSSLVLTDVTIVASTTTVVITWNSNVPTNSTLSWERNVDGSQGTVSEVGLRTMHSISLDNLFPDTNYVLTIVSDTKNGTKLTTTYNFKTFPKVLYTPLPNVTNLKIVLAKNNGVLLTWDNPPAGTFDTIKVVRATKFFPRDPSEGYEVYVGNGSYAVDANSFPASIYYYTVFTLNKKGEYSSGTIGTFLPKTHEPLEVVTTPFGTTTIPNILTDGDTGTKNKNDFFTSIPSRIVFSQDGQTLPYQNGIVEVDTLKTVVVQILNGIEGIGSDQAILSIWNNGKRNDFLFQIKSDGTREASVPSVLLTGMESYSITLLSQNKEIYLQGEFRSKSSTFSAQKNEDFSIKYSLFFDLFYDLFWLIMLLILARFFRKNIF